MGIPCSLDMRRTGWFPVISPIELSKDPVKVAKHVFQFGEIWRL